jgi:hypothetical protein
MGGWNTDLLLSLFGDAERNGVDVSPRRDAKPLTAELGALVTGEEVGSEDGGTSVDSEG